MASKSEALGRSRGGLGTKIVGVCDAAGRLVGFLLTPGQAHELAPSLTLLHRLSEAPSWVLVDMAYDTQAFGSDVRAMGAIPVVPFPSWHSRRGAKQPEPCPDYIYRHRNLIERCWSRHVTTKPRSRMPRESLSPHHSTGLNVQVGEKSNANGP
jgi:putative transposase